MFVALGVLALGHLGVGVGGLVSGFGEVVALLARAVPPTLGDPATTFAHVLDTLWMAIAGTALATVLAAVLGVLAASKGRERAGGPGAWRKVVRPAALAVIVACRAVPDVVFAVFFVAAIGIGPLPGVLALGLHSVGMLGKLFAEAVEQADTGVREAVAGTGAGPGQRLLAGVLRTQAGRRLRQRAQAERLPRPAAGSRPRPRAPPMSAARPPRQNSLPAMPRSAGRAQHAGQRADAIAATKKTANTTSGTARHATITAQRAGRTTFRQAPARRPSPGPFEAASTPRTAASTVASGSRDGHPERVEHVARTWCGSPSVGGTALASSATTSPNPLPARRRRRRGGAARALRAPRT
ncbi:PhnE/PtxC family ABC transporter permease [Nonomuraea rubra]|uniref:PhnE/PtxC family ABC transporter permease n=1 Tax=Nonomuraea rubra TaxID=46180 RepID=UPI0031EAC531